MTYSTKLPPVIVPLGREAHRLAQEFAVEQSTPQIGKRVYINTLAVYAVDSFLQWVEIETDLEAGDSWNPLLCGVLDAADLVLPHLGRLQCCPVLPGETAVDLPMKMKMMEDVIAYVAVQFSDRLDKVQLLGFTPAVDVSQEQDKLLFTELQPLESLEDYLNRLASGALAVPRDEIASPPLSSDTDISLDEMLGNLRQWFHNLFEGDWLAPSMVLAPAYRRGARESEDSIKRAKIIDLGADQAVALVVQLTPEPDAEVGASIWVYPRNDVRHLPLGLQVIAIDESGATILEEQAESGADSIQLEFGIEPRERFSVRLILGNVTVTESI